MNTRYIVRFDDICSTMDWGIWEQIESILNRHEIKPIIAVIPDNCDPDLIIDPARIDFWEKVRSWQNAGWTIALHGYQHLYSTRHSGITKINNYSEFVGLTYEEQRSKLERGLAIFKENGVRAEAWIAPAHSFDGLTIRALLELGINVISDGYYLSPIRRLGATWIPQQLWRFRAMPYGLWTVCFHSNEFGPSDISSFESDIKKYAPSIISFDKAIQSYSVKEYGISDKVMEYCWQLLMRVRKRRVDLKL